MFGLSPQLLGALLLGFGLFAAGWTVEGWRMRVKMYALKTEYAKQSVKVAEESAKRMEAARALGESLAAKVAEADNARIATEESVNVEIRRLTTGRRCLDAAAVRVLNNAGGIRPPAVSSPTGQPVSTDAAFATDTDVGQWAAGCSRYYDNCRSRIDAIREFYSDK